MKKPIALTGSIGSGKSAVASLLAAKGAAIIDADVIARDLLLPGTDCYHETIQLLGPDILKSDGSIDRKVVAKRIFVDSNLRLALEGILHPRVHSMFRERVSAIQQQSPDSIIVYAVPLLFETGMDRSEFSEIVVVDIALNTALQRVVERDSCSLEHAQQRYAAQIPIEQKVSQATYVIDNNGSKEELAREVAAFWKHLTGASA